MCYSIYTAGFHPNERRHFENTTELFAEYCDVVSVDDVTKMLKLSKVTVYKLLKSGKIRTIKVGKRYIIPKRCVSEFLESC